MTHRTGLTMVETIVTLLILVAVVVLQGCFITSALRDANRSGCQANLKSVGVAYLEYGRANLSAFPRLPDSNPNMKDGWGNPFAPWRPASDTDSISSTHMNNVWPLIDYGMIPVTGFKCPADDDWTDRMSPHMCGWGDSREYSFGLHYIYAKGTDMLGAVASGSNNPADPTLEYDSMLASTAGNGILPNQIIMADKNPRRADPSTGQGAGAYDDGQSNHRGGLAYLTKAGNVGFYEGSDDSTVMGDDIYLAESEGRDFRPGTSDDVVIVADPW